MEPTRRVARYRGHGDGREIYQERGKWETIKYIDDAHGCASKGCAVVCLIDAGGGVVVAAGN